MQGSGLISMILSSISALMNFGRGASFALKVYVDTLRKEQYKSVLFSYAEKQA